MTDRRQEAAELQERLGIMVQDSGKDYAIVDYDALERLAGERDEAVAALRRLKSMTVAESPMGRIVRNALDRKRS